MLMVEFKQPPLHITLIVPAVSPHTPRSTPPSQIASHSMSFSCFPLRCCTSCSSFSPVAFTHIAVVTFYPQAPRNFELFSCTPTCCILHLINQLLVSVAPSHSHTFSHLPIVRRLQLPILMIIPREDIGVTFPHILFPFTFYSGSVRFNFTFGPTSSPYISSGHERTFLPYPGRVFFLFFLSRISYPPESLLITSTLPLGHRLFALHTSFVTSSLAPSPFSQCLTEVCVVRTYTTYRLSPPLTTPDTPKPHLSNIPPLVCGLTLVPPV